MNPDQQNNENKDDNTTEPDIAPRQAAGPGMVFDSEEPKSTPSRESTIAASPEKPKKSKKKLVIVTVILLLLAVAGTVAYMMLSNSDDQPVVEAPAVPQEETTLQKVGFSTSNAYYAVSDSSEATAVTELSEDQTIVDVSDDQSIIAFTKDTANSNTAEQNSLWIKSGEEETKVADLPNGQNTVLGSISPDNKEIDYFDYVGDGTEQTFEIGTFNLDDGSKTVWHKFDSDGTLLTSPTWANNDTLISQQATCFQCDGPRYDTFWKIERDSDTPEQIVDLNEDDSYIGGQFIIDVENGTLYASAQNYSALGSDSDEVKDSTTEVYKVQIADGTKEEIYSESGVNTQIYSLSSDRSSLLASEAKVSEEQDSESGINYDTPVIQRIDVESASASPIPLTLTQLEDPSYYFTDIALNDTTKTLYFGLSTYNNESSEFRDTLNSLILEGEGDQPVKTLYDVTSTSTSEGIKDIIISTVTQ